MSCRANNDTSLCNYIPKVEKHQPKKYNNNSRHKNKLLFTTKHSTQHTKQALGPKNNTRYIGFQAEPLQSNVIAILMKRE